MTGFVKRFLGFAYIHNGPLSDVVLKMALADEDARFYGFARGSWLLGLTKRLPATIDKA